MSTWLTILITLLVIAVLILVHEWGHFIVARKIGIPIWEFSIGFGYRLFSVKKDGIEYSVRLIPLGGYVRMAGEEPGDETDPKGYLNRTPLEKMAVAFAGPFMNFIMALLVFIFVYSFIGIATSPNEPLVGKVLGDKPAAQAGLQEGDRILAVNGVEVDTWTEMTAAIDRNAAGEEMELTIQRGATVKTLKLTPVVNETTGKPGIGILAQVVYEKKGIWEGVKIGSVQTYQATADLLTGLGILVSGGASMNDLAGPVGITQLVGQFAQLGFVTLLMFAAFLSINLGILNLLPIPALDGSKIVFAVVEAIRHKPLEPEKEGFIHWLGFLFLILLMVLVTFNDIARLFR